MKFMKRITAWMLTVLLIMSILPTSFMLTVVAAEFEDFPTGWSAEAVQAAVDNGLLRGKANGKIEPQASLTRAEAAAIINRAFGSTVKADISSFVDVNPSDWYYDDMAKAVNMKTFVGDGNHLYPNNTITREEVFTVVARALVLSDYNTDVLKKFSDYSNISDYALPYLAALAKNGYINGNPDGTLNPKSDITREEFAQMMHNIFKTYISQPGTVTIINIQDSVMIRSAGVTLKNVTIEKDLVLGDGVGIGDIKLENVKIKGRLLCRGGEGYVHLVNTTVGDKVVVYDVNGTVNFYNYETEPVFKGHVQHTPATFLNNMTINSGGGSGGTDTKYYNIEMYFQKESVLPGEAPEYGGSDSVYDMRVKAKEGKQITLDWDDINDLYDNVSGWDDILKAYELDTEKSVLSGKNNGRLELSVYLKKKVFTVTAPDSVEYKYFYNDTIDTNDDIISYFNSYSLEQAELGYDVEWYDDDGALITDDYRVTDNITIEIEATPITYTITYVTNGGNPIPNGSFTVETPTFNLPIATKENNEFAGWHKTPGLTDDVITQIVAGTVGNMTLYADWTPLGSGSGNKTYNVNVYFQNDSVLPGDTPAYGASNPEYSRSFEETENAAITYTWADINTLYSSVSGWEDIINMYELDETESVLTGTNNGSLEIKVYLKKKVFTVIAPNDVEYKYFYNSALNTNDAFAEYYNSLNALKLSQGYDVIWEDSNGNPLTLDYAVTGNMTIEADVEPIPYTITYDTNGGDPLDDTAFNVETPTFALPTPVKGDYVFVGWHRAEDLSDDIIEEIEEGTIGSMTLYAEWAPDLLWFEAEKSGEQIVVKVKLTNVPDDISDLSALNIEYSYDDTKLTYNNTVSAIDGALNASAGRIIWTGTLAEVPADDTLFTITFDIIPSSGSEVEFAFVSTELKDSTEAIAAEYATRNDSVDLGGPYYTIKVYDGVERPINILNTIYNVEKDTILTKEEIFPDDEDYNSPEDFAVEGYTDSDGNIHYIVPELMYNNNGTWETFVIGTTKVESDLALCLLNKTISVSILTDRTIKGIEIPEILIEVSYDSESSISESILDGLTYAKNQMETIIDLVETEKGINLYDELIAKLSAKGITDANGTFIAKDIALKMADFISADQIEGKIDEYIEDKLNDDEFIASILQNDSIVNSLLGNEELKKSFMSNEELRNKLLSNEEFIKDMAADDAIVDKIISSEEFKSSFINNDATFDYIMHDDNLKQKILDDANFRKILIDECIKLVIDVYFEETKTAPELYNYIDSVLMSDDFIKEIESKDELKDMFADEIKDLIKNADDAVKAELFKQIRTSDTLKNEIIEAIKNDDEINASIKDTVKNALSTPGTIRTTIISVVRDMIDTDSAVKLDVMNAVRDAFATNDSLKDEVMDVVKDMIDGDPNLKADAMDAVKDAFATNDSLKDEVMGVVKDMLNGDPNLKADAMDAVKDAFATNDSLKDEVMGVVKDMLNGDPDLKTDAMDAVKDAFATNDSLKDEVMGVVKDMLNGDSDLKTDAMNAVRDAFATNDSLKDEVVKAVKDYAKADLEEPIKNWVLDNLLTDADVKRSIVDYIKADEDILIEVLKTENPELYEQYIADDSLTLDDPTIEEAINEHLNDENKLKNFVDTKFDVIYESNFETLCDEMFDKFYVNDDIFTVAFNKFITINDGENFEVAFDEFVNNDEIFEAAFDEFITMNSGENFEEAFDEFVNNDEIFEAAFDEFITMNSGENFEETFDELINNDEVFETAFDEFITMNSGENFEEAFDELINNDEVFETAFDEFITMNSGENFEEAFDEFITMNNGENFDKAFDEFISDTDNFKTAFEEYISEDANLESAFDTFVNDEEKFDNFYNTYIGDDERFNELFEKYYPSHVHEVAKEAYNNPELKELVDDYIRRYTEELAIEYAEGTLEANHPELVDTITRIMEDDMPQAIRDAYVSNPDIKDLIDDLIESNAEALIGKYINNELSDEEKEIINDAIADYADEVATSYIDGTIDAYTKDFVDAAIEEYVEKIVDDFVNNVNRDEVRELIMDYAEEAVNAFKDTDAYKNLIDGFKNGDEYIAVNAENLILVRGIATAVESYTYEQIKEDFLNEKLQKILDLVGDSVFEKYVNEATSGFATGLNEVCDQVDEDVENGIDDSEYLYPAKLRADVNVVSEILYPAYNKIMAKAKAKIASIPEAKYDENPYLQKLVETNLLDDILFDSSVNALGETVYSLKRDISGMYSAVLKNVILAHDAVTWYGKFGDDALDAKAAGAAAILATYANKLNEIIMNYIENGELPKGYTLEDILELDSRIEDAYNRVDEYIEKALEKYEQYFDRDYEVVFEKLATGSIVANGERFDAVDIVVETKVFDVDDAFDAVLGGNNFAGNKYVDKIVNKLNSTKYTPEASNYKYYVDAYKATLDNRTIKGISTGNTTVKVERYLN